jgi:hypothetical protein
MTGRTPASPTEEFIARYTALWNERDPGRRRAEVEQLWTPDAILVDPFCDVAGWDAIEAQVEDAQREFPGMTFRLDGPVDAHHRTARMPWAMAPPDGPAALSGIDILIWSEDGRLSSVLGFFDNSEERP